MIPNIQNAILNKPNIELTKWIIESVLQYKLKHRDAGYGFTVRGPHPIRVGRIKVGGPAEEAGLRKGDVILSINDEPINEQDMQQVAYMIRWVTHMRI